MTGGEREQRIGQIEHKELQCAQRLAPKQAQGGHHLIVARTAGVNMRAGGGMSGEKPLQRGVAILISARDRERAGLRLLHSRQQADAQFAKLFPSDHSDRGQHGSVRQRGHAIGRHQCAVELVVVADGELLDQRIQRFALIPKLAAG